ncbi:LOW QUALITY PROTEIN: hypothetical protein N665_1537s0004 [Sinapis alba]|nr:LOW QUALITY PROTEIN: hypothetical protein N665_1537s0004 [Sinapis alba]
MRYRDEEPVNVRSCWGESWRSPFSCWGGWYDSFKEDISNDSQLQEKETQAKRVHTVFDTEEASILQDVEIKNGHIVTNSFFLDIAEPGKWLSDEVLQKERMVIFDQYFTKIIQSHRAAFSAHEVKLHFDWGKNIASYVTGKSMGKKHKLELGRDMVSAQLLLGAHHWVGLCFNLRTSHVTILDSYIPHSETEQEVDSHMALLLSSLPYILEQYGVEGVRFYSWSRLEDIYHNQRSGDCGPCATKFIEMHANGLGKEEMSRIKDNSVDRF